MNFTEDSIPTSLDYIDTEEDTDYYTDKYVENLEIKEARDLAERDLQKYKKQQTTARLKRRGW